MWKTMTANNMGFLSDADSLRAFTPDEADAEAQKAESTINNHHLVKSLRADPTLSESRPHLKMPANYRARSLTAGALSGPRKVPVPAYQWLAPEGKAITAITYVGEDLCGHPGIVHGGFLATMLDEGLARCCFDALPHKIGVTANLNIDYRKPTPSGSFLVLKAETTKVEGRKAWVKGHIELLAAPGEKPTILAEATALYISPKFAKVSISLLLPRQSPLTLLSDDAQDSINTSLTCKRATIYTIYIRVQDYSQLDAPTL
jgi:adenylylsulfate kinase